jgi:3-oxoacyl-[acyl-carrier-protein] synthase III
MAIFSTEGVVIRAIAAAVPRHRERNIDFARISEAERALLIKTTGVEERRLAPPTLTTSDLCFEAANRILAECGIHRDEIGILVFVSQSGDYYLPATAALLQDRLGLSRNTIAFDVGLGCSGYIYGLAIIASMMRTCRIKNALLLTGDVSSTTLSPEDKSTYPLFGDAGAATLIQASDKAIPWHFNLMTDGSGADSIMIPDGGTRNKIDDHSFDVEDIADGIRRHRLNLILKGPEIFAFATKEVPLSVRELADHHAFNIQDIDFFVMHQANRLMNETIRKKLLIASEKVPYSLDQFGNTSSASIPLTIVTRMHEAMSSKPLRLLLSGFGVGLSWGNVLLNTDRVICSPLIEL